MPSKALVIKLAVMVMMTGLVSCKAKQDITLEDRPVIQDQTLPEKDTALRRPIRTLKISRIEGSLSVNGNTMDIKGNIAVRRDSLIVVSVIPALGYEALRILARPDSILVLNRKEKTFFISPLSDYLKHNNIPLEFFIVQAMFVNEIFYYKTEKENAEIRILAGSDMEDMAYKIENYKNDRLASTQEIIPFKNRLIPRKIVIEDYENRIKAFLTYSNFIYSQEQLFPMSAELILLTGNKTFELKLEFGKVVFGEPINATFQVPGSYSRILI